MSRKYKRRKSAQAISDRSRRLQIESLEARHLLAADPIISEFMASNESTIDDGYGGDSDWIEIYNAGDEPVDLFAHHLTDSQTSLTKWSFRQSTVLAPGEFLLVFASGEDAADPAGYSHTNFKLKAGGEYVALVAPDQTVLSQIASDGADYPEQFADISYGHASAGAGGVGSIGYLATPTPGESNSDAFSQGPLVSNVNATPSVPQTGQPITITASLTPIAATVDTVTLTYRRMFDDEVMLIMRDDGLGGDDTANDQIYSATIPGNVVVTGEMVRWFVSAEDSSGEMTRSPAYLDRTDSAEYHGVVVADPDASDDVPVLYWFVESPTRAASRTGTRASIQFRGQFYDNIQVDLHGQSTSGSAFVKKSYDFDANSGDKFDIADGVGRASDFNLLTNYADQTKIRHPLAYEVYRRAGIPTGLAFPVSVHQNGEFYGLYDFVEEGDEEQLERLGLDEENNLYKVNNRLTSAFTDVEQKTGTDTSREDLQEVVDANRLGSRAGQAWDWDNFDMADMVNYFAVGHLIYNHDFGHKNMYWYRDVSGTGLWSVLPWDVDLSFGHVWTSNVSPSYFDNRLNINGGLTTGWNDTFQRMLNNNPDFRSMLNRRYRTLMDDFYGSPDESTEDGFLAEQIRMREELLRDEIAADTAEWGIHRNYSSAYPFNPADAVDELLEDWLPSRKRYLEGVSTIPDAHDDQSDIRVGTIEANPMSGDSAEQYIVLENHESFAVDVSGWNLSGVINHTLKPGTVIPPNGELYLVSDVQSFLSREIGPGGGQNLFLQGAQEGAFDSTGGVLQLSNVAGDTINASTFGRDADFNDDGLFGCVDLNLLTTVVGSNANLDSFDINGDGLVNHADLDTWFSQAALMNLPSGATYQAGDANLDGVVDAGDFAIWNANRFSASASWCNGDFNTDGFVDVSDFNLWNQSQTLGAQASIATAPVPDELPTELPSSVYVPRAATPAIAVTVDPTTQSFVFTFADSPHREMKEALGPCVDPSLLQPILAQAETPPKLFTQFQTRYFTL